MKRGTTSKSDQKLKKAREDAERSYPWQPNVKLVDHMMELAELFTLSMSENNELSEYLAQNSEHYSLMKKISKGLQVVLDKDMNDFILALKHMLQSKGYSMIKFLESEPDTVEFLQKHILVLDKVYFGLLLYRREKILAELDEYTDDSEESLDDNSESEHDSSTKYLPYKSKQTNPNKDETDYDEGCRNPFKV
jgi:hypothetical protein